MIYLLHISPPYKHARHYIGFANDVTARIAEHRAGTGARLPQVAVEAGSKLVLVRTWPGGRNEERRLKNRKNAPKLCPICNQTHSIDFELLDVPEMAF
jgi:predicted GIY-YIG superfamily endonuclease